MFLILGVISSDTIRCSDGMSRSPFTLNCKTGKVLLLSLVTWGFFTPVGSNRLPILLCIALSASFISSPNSKVTCTKERLLEDVDCISLRPSKFSIASSMGSVTSRITVSGLAEGYNVAIKMLGNSISGKSSLSRFL